jgi:DNA-nicking Smr family endonuclease
MAGGRRRRPLNEEEQALWQKVAESVEPLLRARRRRGKPILPEPIQEDPPVEATVVAVETPSPPPTKPKHKQTAHPARANVPHKPPPTPLAPIDAKTRRKIVRGAVPLEERIDLHGLTQADAYRALRGFIAGARARGVKMVLVITGKGRSFQQSEHHVFTPEERGVLRRLVPQWLSLPDMRDYVIGFEEAHVAHGGAGAIYVRLRKARVPRAGTAGSAEL